MSDFTPTVTGTGAKAAVQRFGAFLAGMVMPNLGAFIAFGLVTAIFIPTGWINTIAGTTDDPLPITTQMATLVGPLISLVIVLLIGYTGGRMVHGQRGAVVGAVATLGAMVSTLALGISGLVINADAGALPPPANISEISPNILGAFVMGPLAALVLKFWDNAIAGKVKGGFEMLVDNFSAGIIGGIMAAVGIYIVGPVTFYIGQALGVAANWLISVNLLPLVSIVVEPAKILFLNNAINHGVFTPLGAQADGASIFFMIESNPGPGIGILVAMLLFGPRAIRPTVPAALVVHALGGIHEIYFPYVLMKPILVIAAILGGATGVLWETIFGLGLLGPASPGSIIAWALVSPPGFPLVMNMIGIALAAAVSFITGAVLLGFGRKESAVDAAIDLEAAQEQSAANKKASKQSPATA